MKEIYPQELALTSDNAVLQANYLDLSLEISNNKITHKLYDKRDAFGFSIVNFPDLSGNIPKKHSHGVLAPQLIRYARCCQEKVDFIDRSKKLIDRLVKQNFSRQLLRRSFVSLLFRIMSFCSNIVILLLNFVILVVVKYIYILVFLSLLCCVVIINCHYMLKDLELSFISLARVSFNKEDNDRSCPCMTF